ncbi:MAG: SDR family NAD(P)-dependent oxidoreductase [Bacteroidales bacterium]
MKLTKNTILITGGSSGIGLTLGRALLKLDNQVILLGRNKTKLHELEKEGFKTIVCDMANQEEIENATIKIQNNFPKLNILLIMLEFNSITTFWRMLFHWTKFRRNNNKCNRTDLVDATINSAVK